MSISFYLFHILKKRLIDIWYDGRRIWNLYVWMF